MSDQKNSVSTEPQPVTTSGIAPELDPVIRLEAERNSISPALVKAIIQKESNFNRYAVNPEKSGVSAGSLRTAILTSPDGGDDALRRFAVDPSLGLMQVRVTTARQFFPQSKPVELFEPASNIQAGARFVGWLFEHGITEDQIDAYNVGLAAFRRGVRNSSYRNDVLRFKLAYEGDFA